MDSQCAHKWPLHPSRYTLHCTMGDIGMPLSTVSSSTDICPTKFIVTKLFYSPGHIWLWYPSCGRRQFPISFRRNKNHLIHDFIWKVMNQEVLPVTMKEVPRLGKTPVPNTHLNHGGWPNFGTHVHQEIRTQWLLHVRLGKWLVNTSSWFFHATGAVLQRFYHQLPP